MADRMTPNKPSPIVIPKSPRSTSPLTSTQTGRPPLWTNSSQRKMCRLYLYTTLPINKILEVVHYSMPLDSIPGKDSANKKLNALLDKEPRWLKPKNESDMFRRCEQLARSSARSYDALGNPRTSRSHSHSAPPPCTATPIENERDAYSETLDVPPWAHSPNTLPPSSPCNRPSSGSLSGNSGGHGRSVSDNVASGLMRPGSNNSTATDDSADPIHRILDGYSDEYIRTVKLLIKQYTVPISEDMTSPSPYPEPMLTDAAWITDPDAATPFITRPFPLPGDFLNIDIHAQQRYLCNPDSEVHQQRRCICHAQMMENPHSTWVKTEGAPSPADQMYERIVSHLEFRDTFGNSVLHLLAARASEPLLLDMLQSNLCASIFDVRNTAGQTFLHALRDSWLQKPDALIQLLDLLAVKEFAPGQKFDLMARDHYGRTWFHTLFTANIAPSTLQSIIQRYSPLLRCSRDAFGFLLPSQEEYAASVQYPSSPQPMDVDSGTESPKLSDSVLLETARLAHHNPRLEDAHGRNGLHCLAMASLSVKSVMDKANLAPQPNAGRQRKKGKVSDERLDSSEDRLLFRRSLVEGLLNSRIDPNHYDHFGNTPLMTFCAELPEEDDYKTGPKILELLIDRGANINARNRAGETALHIAARCGRKLAIRELLRLGANHHARDAAGRGVLALVDDKMRSCKENLPVNYCHYEACRAHLSGRGFAVQEPTVAEEWAQR